jgi:hypothetical protein
METLIKRGQGMKGSILASVILFFSSSFVFAADLELTVCQVGVEGTADVFLQPCENYTSQQSCPNGTWMHWTLNNEAAKGKLSVAQAALVSGNKIVARLNGCSAGFDDVYMLRLKKS